MGTNCCSSADNKEDRDAGTMELDPRALENADIEINMLS